MDLNMQLKNNSFAQANDWQTVGHDPIVGPVMLLEEPCLA